MSASCSPVAFQGSQEAALSTFQKRPLGPIFEASEETCNEDRADDCRHLAKRRIKLSVQQVKALECNFQIENKLEPERKRHLARELELQPKQVAIWFQNRRARSKAKQLGIDYDILRERYEMLRADLETLLQEKQKLQAQVMEINEKLRQQNENILRSSDGKGIVVDSLMENPEIYVKLGSGVETITAKTEIPLEEGGTVLHSLSICKLSLEVKQDVSSSSDSDDSNILDVDSPTDAGSTQRAISPMQHQNCSEILTLGGLDAGLLNLVEDLYGRVHSPAVLHQRAPIKLLEDRGGTEEYCNGFLTIEDQQAGANSSCWDWS